MARLELRDLSYYYDEFYHPVFEHVNLRLDSDWNLGLIGRNGKGKTTLLNLLAGELEPSSGTIDRIGSISKFPYSHDKSFIKTMDVVKECVGNFATMERNLAAMQKALEEGNGDAEAYCELLDRYANAGGYEVENQILRELERFGFSTDILERDFQTLSGGEQTCTHVIALFLRKDPFVMLDEPTNHLDVDKRKQLCEYLKKKKGFILVTHDYEFLDQVVDHVLAINKADITLEQGNYSTWKRNMLQKETYERKLQEELIKEVSALEDRVQQSRGWAEVGNRQKCPYKSNERTNGNRAYVQRAKRSEQRILKDIEQKKMLLRNVEEEKSLSLLRQVENEESILHFEGLSFSYDKKRYLFQNLYLSVEQGDRIWIQGKNGCGKSTLLKIILGELDNADVSYAEGIRMAYASQIPRWDKGRIEDLIPPENKKDFDRICDAFDLPKDAYERPLETFSSGELRKIDLARALSQPSDVLILDEPLNYMDYVFKTQLRRALVEQMPTLIFVEHDREFGKAVATKTLYL